MASGEGASAVPSSEATALSELLSEDFDEQQEIARSSFGDMLHDIERNEKYYLAIKMAVNKMHRLGKKARVLDIGTGSGLLSMMAAKCGADSVIACEAFAPIGECAKQVLKVNGFSDKIEIILKHSTQLTVGDYGDLPEKANILVAEVFDTELIGEGALKAFSHAHQELLEKDCIVVPSSATMFAQVVESQAAHNWNRFNDFVDEDGELLVQIPAAVKQCAGGAAVHDLQLSQVPKPLFKQIAKPKVIFSFDWSGETPILFNETAPLKIVAKSNGMAHAVFMWWELSMDPESTIILSCAPYWEHPYKRVNPDLTSINIPWRDHWLQAIYYLPKEMPVRRGEELQLISCHDEYSIWFYLEEQFNSSLEYKTPVCDCSLHAVHSRTRVGQINHVLRRRKYLSFIKKHVTKDSVILLLGNGFYLGLAAAKFGAKKLIFIEDNPILAASLNTFIKANYIANCEILDNISMLRDHEDLHEISIIFAEPYFTDSILPWDNVKFAYMIKDIKEFLKQDVIIAPKECIIRGIIVEFHDLYKIRFPVEVCGEFDLKPFDDVVQKASTRYDPEIEAHPLWEYPCIARTKTTTLCRLSMEDIAASSKTEEKNFLIPRHKTNYNGIAFWVDWQLENVAESIITTGPISLPMVGHQIKWDVHTRQGVKFLRAKTIEDFRVVFKFGIQTGKVHMSIN